MADPKDSRTRGLVHRVADHSPFALARYHASPDLEDLVEDVWIVRWDLGDRAPYDQEVLSHPNVTLAVDDGPGGESAVFGVVTGRFVRTLTGRGRAVGVKFWPGAYAAIHGARVDALTDRRVPLAIAFGAAGAELQADVGAETDDDRIVERLERFLRGLDARPDEHARRARAIVARIASDPGLRRVEAVAAAFDTGVRALQRLLRAHVGVGPKWLVQRYRLHEALARLTAGESVDLAALALELGYCDQAHLTREFKRLVGSPPATYGRALRAPDGPR